MFKNAKQRFLISTAHHNVKLYKNHLIKCNDHYVFKMLKHFSNKENSRIKNNCIDSWSAHLN